MHVFIWVVWVHSSRGQRAAWYLVRVLPVTTTSYPDERLIPPHLGPEAARQQVLPAPADRELKYRFGCGLFVEHVEVVLLLWIGYAGNIRRRGQAVESKVGKRV